MIRQATPEDLQRIVEMALSFISSSRYAHLFAGDPVRIRAVADALIAELGFILVDEQLEGMLGVLVAPHEFSGTLIGQELAWFVEQRRRKGTLGPKLLYAAEHLARQKGCSMLKMVAPSQTDVGKFYEHAGYSLIETVYIKTL